MGVGSPKPDSALEVGMTLRVIDLQPAAGEQAVNKGIQAPFFRLRVQT